MGPAERIEGVLLDRCAVLRPQAGDLLVLTVEAGNYFALHSAQAAAQAIQDRYGPDLFFVILQEGQTLEQADEAAMNAAGWFRADKPLLIEDKTDA